MAMSAPGKITAWSFSRWQTYEDCPFKAKCKFVDKLPEPPAGPAVDRGIAMHSLAEELITGNPIAKPEDAERAEKFRAEFKAGPAKLFKAEFAAAKKGKPLTETEWAFTKDWQATSWFGRDAWCRIKTDLVFNTKNELLIVDHKTGKRNAAHELQLSLYAIGGFLTFSSIDKIGSQLWYFDHGAPIPRGSYKREELPDMIATWEERVRPMLTDTRFVPKPSRACSWCPFSKAKGGPCKF